MSMDEIEITCNCNFQKGLMKHAKQLRQAAEKLGQAILPGRTKLCKHCMACLQTIVDRTVPHTAVMSAPSGPIMRAGLAAVMELPGRRQLDDERAKILHRVEQISGDAVKALVREVVSNGSMETVMAFTNVTWFAQDNQDWDDDDDEDDDEEEEKIVPTSKRQRRRR